MTADRLTRFVRARLAEEASRLDDMEPATFEDDPESVRGPGWGRRNGGACTACGAWQFDGTEDVTEMAWWEHVEEAHAYTYRRAVLQALDVLAGYDHNLLTVATIWRTHPDYPAAVAR